MQQESKDSKRQKRHNPKEEDEKEKENDNEAEESWRYKQVVLQILSFLILIFLILLLISKVYFSTSREDLKDLDTAIYCFTAVVVLILVYCTTIVYYF